MTNRQEGAGLVAIGPHFAVAPVGDGTTGSALALAVAGVRALPGALVVVIAAADASPALRAALPELAGLAAARGATTVVLAASGLAAPDPDGVRPAQQIAAQAGLPVTAPDGMVSFQPDGTLLVTPAGNDDPASW